MKFLAILLFSNFFIVKIYAQNVVEFDNISQETKDAATSQGKVWCYNCNMPEQCNSGLCIGDYCVKAIVDGRYVTKGCENRTSVKNSPVPSTYPGGIDTITVSGSYRTTNYSKDNNLQDLSKLGCRTMEMFKVPQTTCYCNDKNFCNSSSKLQSLKYISFILPFIFIFIIIFR
uniref:Protein quiver n=1 Tax=Strongyloides papillosus TaxID=174720 RepID=A0A0N5BW10_STREA